MVLVNKLKKILSLTSLLFVLIFSVSYIPSTVQAQQTDSQQSILFFYGQGCPHCAKVESYFEEIKAYENYPLVKKEIYFDRNNAAEFNKLMEENGVPIEQRGVPTLVAGKTVISGDQPIIEGFIDTANNYLSQNGMEVTPPPQETKEDSKSSISLWLIISASLVDAINPCAFAVLLILLTTVLAQKNSRKKVIASGMAFSLAIFVSYLLMGFGLYTALASAGTTSLITKIVGILAIVLGLFNLKDWLWYGKTAPLEVPMSWRPKMASIIEKVTSPAGAIVAGLLVSLFLLPCTSGPYIVVLGLLAENPVDLQLIWYLVIYNLVFILPMLIITFAVAFGLKVDTVARLREQHIDKLHLVAGLILIGLGAYVLISL